MTKTYFMGDGKLSDEEREQVKNADASQSEQAKQLSDADLGREKEKKMVTIEQLLRTRLEPHADRVIVYPDPIATVTEGGIIKPQEAIEKERPATGTVLAVGPGKLTQSSLTNRLLLAILVTQENRYDKELFDELVDAVDKGEDIPLHPGDRIMYGRFAGTPTQDPDTKEEVLIMRPHDIFGKIRE